MSYIATIGFFDGVHIGHQQVISRLKTLAGERGLQTMVVTFGNHPMEVVRPEYTPDLLLSLDEKLQRLMATGVDSVETLLFTREMMQQPAYDFMEKVLRDEFDVKALLIGYDNRFGRRNEKETFESYVEYGKALGIEVIEGPRPEECGLFEGTPVSSSLIRQLLKDGRTSDAKHLMG